MPTLHCFQKIAKLSHFWLQNGLCLRGVTKIRSSFNQDLEFQDRPNQDDPQEKPISLLKSASINGKGHFHTRCPEGVQIFLLCATKWGKSYPKGPCISSVDRITRTSARMLQLFKSSRVMEFDNEVWSSIKLQKHGYSLHVPQHNLPPGLVVIDFTIGSVLSKPTLTCWVPNSSDILSKEQELLAILALHFLPFILVCCTIFLSGERWLVCWKATLHCRCILTFRCWTQRLKGGLLLCQWSSHSDVVKESYALSKKHFWSSTTGSRIPDH